MNSTIDTWQQNSCSSELKLHELQSTSAARTNRYVNIVELWLTVPNAVQSELMRSKGVRFVWFVGKFHRRSVTQSYHSVCFCISLSLSTSSTNYKKKGWNSAFKFWVTHRSYRFLAKSPFHHPTYVKSKADLYKAENRPVYTVFKFLTPVNTKSSRSWQVIDAEIV